MTKEDEFDNFYLKRIFPDAESIFSIRQLKLDEIKSDCIFVIDTTALLVPYGTSPGSLEEIKKIYSSLIEKEKLFVPAHVAREFAKNRPQKLVELYEDLHKAVSSLQSITKINYPQLESLNEYKKAGELAIEANMFIKKYRDSLQVLQNCIKEWNWDDPISELYKELFTQGVIREIQCNQKDLEEMLNYRNKHKVPPGFDDAKKTINKAGDLIIWRTILEIGADKKKPVVFVSNDKKGDWWHKTSNHELYPRFELVYEFNQATDGLSFHLISFERFLTLLGASEGVIQEIKEERLARGSFGATPLDDPVTQKTSIVDWLYTIYPQSSIAGDVRIDHHTGAFAFNLLVSNQDEDIGVFIIQEESPEVLDGILTSALDDGHLAINYRAIQKLMVFIVDTNADRVRFHRPKIHDLVLFHPINSVDIIAGHFDKHNTFHFEYRLSK
ncbi:MAG: PIN domain-containing protein [Candidatus Odinarchaeota archaeon]